MPRYDMRCTKCGQEAEIDCSMSESTAQTCSYSTGVDGTTIFVCGEPMEILISGTAMKVDGRYQTKAIMGDGSKTVGHFGTSKNRKLGWM